MRTLLAAWSLLLIVAPAAAAEISLPPLLKTIRAVGPDGAGSREAAAAWKQLVQADAAQLPQILAGMDGAEPLASNWIRGAVDAIAERTLAARQSLPAKELEAFLADRSHAPRARRLAFEWLARIDESAADRLIPTMKDDPSLELRRDAVTRLLTKAEELAKAQDAGAPAALAEAFAAARDFDQIESIAKKLKELGQEPDLNTHMGFIDTWQVIAPFDNTDKRGFAVAYPPEEKIDLTAEYDGKEEKVAWKEVKAAKPYGEVDINTLLKKHMGAVAYATATFVSDKEQTVDLRLACTNANKIWLNGEMIGAHEVYHAGTKIDQYIHSVQLRQGPNVILLKVCQNEQTDAWAQDWSFQLRLCDRVGTAILPAKP